MERTYLEFFLFMRHIPKVPVHTVKKRNHSSVMSVLEGEFNYTYNGGSFTLKQGQSVFLPYGATYSYNTAAGKSVILQIVFDVCDNTGPLSFADHPVKSENTKIAELMERVISKGILPENKEIFSITSDMYKIFAIFFDKRTDSRESLKIYPALRYIEEHYAEKFYSEILAKLCLLSQSQLRRLFNNEIGMSPIEYKNSLRMKAACDLLFFSSQNISEISATLGFENPYIFSRMFKKYMNTSPLNYRKQKK